MFKGSGSISRASSIKDEGKRARKRDRTNNQPRTFMRGSESTVRLFACTKTELRRHKKQHGCTRAEAMRYFS